MTTPEQRLTAHDEQLQALEHGIESGRRALGAAIGQVHTDVLRHRAETRDGFADSNARIEEVASDLTDQRQEMRTGFAAMNQRLNGLEGRLDRLLTLVEERLPAAGDGA